MVGEIIVLALFILLIVFTVGGVIWIFVDEDLSTKRHIKHIQELEKHNKKY